MSKPARAPIGVALIAKDAEKTLPVCLDSFRNHVRQIVVCVDERTEDKTAKVARAKGAEVHSVRVSDWHECESHGRILAQDFARARNESFRWLDPDLDFWLWIDSDDWMENAALLPQLCTAVPKDTAGVWLPYEYSWIKTEQGRKPNTLFHRERLLRTRAFDRRVTWTWSYRVHEVVKPDCDSRWIKSDEVRIVHQEGTHKTENSAKRNLTLLQIDYENDPNDPRTIFYLGNQYFALNDFEQAVYWYEALAAKSSNPYESWQAWVYCGKAYQMLGDPQAAIRANLEAMIAVPDHPEPYYGLAAVYASIGDAEKAIYWTRLGRTKTEPPMFVFKNPLDYSFNHRLPMAHALGQKGQIAEARTELEAACAILQDSRVLETVAEYRKTENLIQQASAFATLCAGKSDAELIQLWETMRLPEDVRRFSRCRDLVMPALIRQRDEGYAA